MNHLFWLWAGGFIVALASTTIATGVFRVKASLRSVLFELLTLVFWPLALPVIYFQQSSIRKELLRRSVSHPRAHEHCEDCEEARQDLQEQWLKKHQTCPTCHPVE